MRGNKRTFPNFHFAFTISMNSNSFHHKTLERRWHDFFHLFKWNGVFENIWISFGNISIHKLHATQWFSWEKIKWLLQNIWNMSWEFQRIYSKSHWNYFSILGLFEFYSNYFSPKIKYMEIRVTWFPTLENWRKINLKSFWYF